MDHNVLIGKIFLISHDKDGEVIHTKVNSRADQFYQEQDMFLVSLYEGQATDIMTYDAITKGLEIQLLRESELKYERKLFSFWNITDHRIIKESN